MSGRLGSKYVFAFDIGAGGSRLKDSRIADSIIGGIRKWIYYKLLKNM